MSEETFRIIVAASVLAAISAFVVQVAVVIALCGLIRKMKRDAAGFLARLGSVFGKVGCLFSHVEPAIEKSERVINSLSSTAAKVRSVMDRLRPLAEQTTLASRQAEVLMCSLSLAAGTSNQIVQDLRPRAADVFGDVRAIVRSVRTQVEDVDGLLHDAGDRVRCRRDQIDHAVNRTVRGFERVSNGVLRAVHKVSGIAAGVSAGVAALVRSAVPR